MRFWDSSAIVPLILDEPVSERVLRFHQTDNAVIVWWGTFVECASAIARRERDQSLALTGANDANARLRKLQQTWHEVTPSAKVRPLALRLLRTHALRTLDAFQLAAALIAAQEEPSSLEIVCLDERLTAAAQREGFTVVA